MSKKSLVQIGRGFNVGDKKNLTTYYKNYLKYYKRYINNKTDFEAYNLANLNRKAYLKRGGKKKLKSLGTFKLEADPKKTRTFKRRGGKTITVTPKTKKRKSKK